MKAKPIIKAIAIACAALVLFSLLLVLLFRWAPVPMSAVMFQRSIAERQWQHYEWTALEDTSPHVMLAVIAAEDQRFPQHHGIDLKEIKAALKTKARGGNLRGASTISQQVARNLFLWQGRSFIRKGLEFYFAALIELFWSKQRIIEVYVNIAETGPRTFGFTAGAERFINKPIKNLSASHAALMAAALPNPIQLKIAAPSTNLKRRQRKVRRQMRQLGGLKYLENIGIKQ